MDLKEIADGLLEVFRETRVMTVSVLSDEGLLAGKVTDIEYVENSEGKPCDIIIATDIEYPFTYSELRVLENLVKYEIEWFKNRDLTIIETSTLEQLKEIHKKIDFAIMYHEAEVSEEADEYEDGENPYDDL